MKLIEGTAAISDLEAFLERLGSIGETHDAAIQAFDARYVAGPQHLRRAVDLADRAIARGENVARNRAVEIMLYAAGRRQIDQALSMGVGEGENQVVAVVTGDDEDSAAEDLGELLEPVGALDGDEEILREFFDISEVELDATDATLKDLVCERVALLDVEK